MAKQQEIDRLAEIVSRQDRAIDAALDVFARLAKRGSVSRVLREDAAKLCREARNEKIPGAV